MFLHPAAHAAQADVNLYELGGSRHGCALGVGCVAAAHCGVVCDELASALGGLLPPPPSSVSDYLQVPHSNPPTAESHRDPAVPLCSNSHSVLPLAEPHRGPF
eukprot:2306444-Prymnesium_polylepis.2